MALVEVEAWRPVRTLRRRLNIVTDQLRLYRPHFRRDIYPASGRIGTEYDSNGYCPRSQCLTGARCWPSVCQSRHQPFQVMCPGSFPKTARSWNSLFSVMVKGLSQVCQNLPCPYTGLAQTYAAFCCRASGCEAGYLRGPL